MAKITKQAYLNLCFNNFHLVIIYAYPSFSYVDVVVVVVVCCPMEVRRQGKAREGEARPTHAFYLLPTTYHLLPTLPSCPYTHICTVPYHSTTYFTTLVKMGRRTKKVGVVGKYGTRYGASLRKQIKKIEITQHAKYTCSFCG